MVGRPRSTLQRVSLSRNAAQLHVSAAHRDARSTWGEDRFQTFLDIALGFAGVSHVAVLEGLGAEWDWHQGRSNPPPKSALLREPHLLVFAEARVPIPLMNAADRVLKSPGYCSHCNTLPVDDDIDSIGTCREASSCRWTCNEETKFHHMNPGPIEALQAI
jgi:hypothetical protein